MIKTTFFGIRKRFLSSDTLKLLPTDSALTRIRIWKSGHFSTDGTFQHTPVGHSILKGLSPFKRANIGHVSLETKDFYASLWPEQLTILNKYKTQSGTHSSLEADQAAEGRPPDHLVDFETLDLPGMLKALEHFELSNQYHLIGNNKIFNANNAASCSSLAYSLLVADGIRKLAPRTVSVRDYLVVTPNNLAEMVIIAKQKEETIVTEEKPRGPSPN